MTLMNFALLTLMIVVMMNPHPMIFLMNLCLIPITIIPLFQNTINSSWSNLILVLIFSGGLLILFLFIISMTPNQINLPISISISMLFPILMTKLSTYPEVGSGSELFNWFFNHSWQTMILITTMILMMMLMICEMIYFPVSSMKSSKT